jgi:hypothetical protein
MSTVSRKFQARKKRLMIRVYNVGVGADSEHETSAPVQVTPKKSRVCKELGKGKQKHLSRLRLRRQKRSLK